MTDLAAVRAFLSAEVTALEPLDFVAAIPGGNLFHTVEMTRGEDGSLEVRIPGRPPPVPALDASVRSGLKERGFQSADPADQKKPWACRVADAAAAVDLALRVVAEVFAEEPGVTLDIAHGNHAREIEVEKNLAIATSRIESIVAEILGRQPERDRDGDYIVPMDEIHVTIAPRAAPTGQIMIRVFAITNASVTISPELGLFLSRLNFGLMFGRFSLDTENRAIWFDETLLGEQFREEELRFAVRTVSATADEWDERLKQMFGGVTYQEVLKGRAMESPPPIKPGSGMGMYL